MNLFLMLFQDKPLITDIPSCVGGAVITCVILVIYFSLVVKK